MDGEDLALSCEGSDRRAHEGGKDMGDGSVRMGEEAIASLESGSAAASLGERAARVAKQVGRQDAQSFLFAHAKQSVGGMRDVGKYRDNEYDRQHRDGAHAQIEPGQIHRGLSPDDILITMGGGDAGGHSCFIPSWSRGRGSIMQHKPIGVCIDCE